MKSQALRLHAVVWAWLTALIVVLAALDSHYQGRKVWTGWTPSSELHHPAYTERIHPNDFFRTKANTWSNLAYVLVGFYGLALGCQDWRQKTQPEAGYLVRTPAMSILFGLACGYLGFGSGIFHGSLTRWGQQLDVASMYAPLLIFTAINLGIWMPRLLNRRIGHGYPTWPMFSALAFLTSYLLYRYKWSMSSGVVLPTLILIVALLAMLNRFRKPSRMTFRWLGISTLALVAARVCWQLDVAGRFSGPDAWYQGHALWHLLTAISLASTYLFYRSEVCLPVTRQNPLPKHA